MAFVMLKIQNIKKLKKGIAITVVCDKIEYVERGKQTWLELSMVKDIY